MKIVVTEPLHMAKEARDALGPLGAVVYGPFDEPALAAELSNCDVLMVRLGRHIGEPLMAAAPNLRFIVTATTGLDHVDLDAARRRNIRIVSLRDCPQAITDVSATAEHCLGLLLALVRGTVPATAHVLGGGFDRNLFFGRQLRGKRLGIVGYGRIGALLAGYGAALGMEVVAHDRDAKKIVAPVKKLPLAELLRSSDVISIHVTADPDNRHLIDKAAIATMKQGAFVLNTARGSLADEEALADAVLNGHLAGVAVDVLDGEERGGSQASPLLAAARAGHNVLITPHIGGATYEAIRQAECAVIGVLAGLVGGAKPQAGAGARQRS
jgi:D-3-phosphoglycerate dehydrogenase